MTRFFKRMTTLLLAAIYICSGFAVLLVQDAGARGCDDVQFIFARGSGEALQAKSEVAWRTAITGLIESTNLQYSFYELGSSEHGGAQYPAVTVAGFEGFGNLLGAYFSAGAAFEFGRSVDAGITELKSYIAEVSNICPETRFVLGGYSQGAMLISRTLPELDANKIIYVATFGDPKLYLPEGAGKTPAACAGKNLSNYRAYVPDCHAYEGILGGINPYQTKEYIDKLGTWCNGKDIMCSSGFMFDDHGEYISRGLYDNAASVIYGKLQSAFPEKVSPATEESIPAAHDMVILLNISSATIGILNQYREEAAKLAREVYSLGGRVALYTYSDSRKLKSQLRCDFSCTAEEFNRALIEGTQFWSTGESVDSTLSTLYTAMSTLEWRVGATKTAVVISPRDFDRVDRDGTRLEDVIELSLKIDPVNVYAITSDEPTRQAYASLVEGTNGKAYSLSGGTSNVYAEILDRPVPGLTLETYAGVVGEEIIFDASGSGRSSSLRFDWDLDGDNIFETTNAGPIATKTHDQPISGYIQVRASDGKNYSSTMSAHLKITATAPEPATIKNLTAEKQAVGTYKISFDTDATKVMIMANEAILGLVEEYSFIINDIVEPITLRLVPYSTDDMRGEPALIRIDELELNQPSQPVVTPGQSTAPPSAVHVTASALLSQVTRTNILKAPNSGVKP